MNAPHTQFEVAQRTAAKEALVGLSDKQRVLFALSVLLETDAPDAVASLRFAANRVTEHADILMRQEFEREFG